MEFFAMATRLEQMMKRYCEFPIFLRDSKTAWNIHCHRRFLRARRFDLKQTKKMFADCQQWRSTVEGVGVDELYRRLDPFDVRSKALKVG
jgi:hypothetical protein